MLKITFWLKKPNTDQGSLESITIDDPKKVLEDKLTGFYSCKVHLPEIKLEHDLLIYSFNPVEAVVNASEFAKVWLQGLIFRGYTISEVESREPWKLEKKDPWVNFQEKISEIKNNQNIPPEIRQKILEMFERTPHRKVSLNSKKS